jgi:NADP-dependent 3-hydroxy acid dehydrogenase YdfG
MVPLDVRSDASVAGCMSAVSGVTDRLDILVNNAGYELAGALEELSLDEAKAQFESCR